RRGLAASGEGRGPRAPGPSGGGRAPAPLARPGATRRRPALAEREPPPAPPWRRRARREASPRRPSVLDPLQALGFLGGHERVDQLVQIALEHGRQAVQREPDAMVGDAGLRKVVGSNPLAPLTGPDLALPIRSDRRLLLLLGALQEPCLEHTHGLRAVLDLRALVLARHDEAARQVRDPHR